MKKLNSAGLDLLYSAAEISMFMLDTTCGNVFVYFSPDLLDHAELVLEKYLDNSEVVILPMNDADQITPDGAGNSSALCFQQILTEDMAGDDTSRQSSDLR